MIQQPLCHGLNFVLLFARWEHNIRMASYFEICRNFEMSSYQFHAVKFYFFFTLFIHEDTFIIEGIHFKLHWLLPHIVLLVVEIFVRVACRLYNLCKPVPFWSVWLHSATPFVIFLTLFILPCLRCTRGWLCNSNEQLWPAQVSYQPDYWPLCLRFFLVSSVNPGKFQDSKLEKLRRIPLLSLFTIQNPVPVSVNSIKRVQL
jgi:hypothetical protein